MPDGFFRSNGSKGTEGMVDVASAFPIRPGRNIGRVNSYTVDPTSADLSTFCLQYEKFVNEMVKGLYPDPRGKLRRALNRNLDFLFLGTKGAGCVQVFPYGQD
jgi:hypothetical protein